MKLTLSTLLVIVLITACKPPGKMTDHNKTPNKLIDQTSPYLLQHAYNPVHWQPWSEEAFEQAKEEQKLMIISIGYSACHWCHVMEHESFEDTGVANIMNQHFVSVKVDREERPDVDQVYMTAVQLMKQQGGWPLNVVALPDGRPIWGGTYFPKDSWKSALMQLMEVYKSEPEKMEEYAAKLAEGIQQSDQLVSVEMPKGFEESKLHEVVSNWAEGFDYKKGGPDRSPKFPIPNNYQFLLKYAISYEREDILEYVKLTLDKMAYGGIYDQIGGGFARYSTDVDWKVPHFEKMLYDNGQLLSLYAEAYGATKDVHYKHIVAQTIDFMARELQSPEGLFYSSLDADSEGEEGKFYCWGKDELKEVLGADFDWVKKYYNINPKGYWEDGKYILLRDMSDQQFADDNNLSITDLRSKVTDVNNRLLEARSHKIRPGLDDKILTSWNALAITGLLDAYQYIQNPEYLSIAKKALKTLIKKVKQKDGRLDRNYKNGKSNINAYLDDYALLAEACLSMYEQTFDEQWITETEQITGYVMKHFSNPENGLFYYTSDLDPALIARKYDVHDNVIPASNSIMAKVLVKLGMHNDNKTYMDRSKKMLSNVHQKMPEYGAGYSNWCMTQMYLSDKTYQIAILGDTPSKTALQLHNEHYIPYKLMMGATNDKSKLPLLQLKYIANTTTIYVCKNRSCKKPVNTVLDAINQINTY
jgi:uncharacterized protein YyaL (SSP411 family)